MNFTTGDKIAIGMVVVPVILFITDAMPKLFILLYSMVV